jgi:hypothetical protein
MGCDLRLGEHGLRKASSVLQRFGIWRFLIWHSWGLLDLYALAGAEAIYRARWDLTAVCWRRLVNNQSPVLIFESLNPRLKLSLQVVPSPCQESVDDVVALSKCGLTQNKIRIRHQRGPAFEFIPHRLELLCRHGTLPSSIDIQRDAKSGGVCQCRMPREIYTFVSARQEVEALQKAFGRLVANV